MPAFCSISHWRFPLVLLSFYYCSKPRLWQPGTRTRIALCWFIHLKCWLFPVNVHSISRAYPRHICSQTPFIPLIIIVCVCVWFQYNISIQISTYQLNCFYILILTVQKCSCDLNSIFYRCQNYIIDFNKQKLFYLETFILNSENSKGNSLVNAITTQVPFSVLLE